MSFGNPNWLWALLLIPLLVAIFFANERRGRQLLDQLVASRLRPQLAGNISLGKRRFQFLLLLLGLALVLLAMARPQYGYTWEEAKRKGRDVIIAIDTSRSMLANDLAPDRLTRAKLAVQDLIQLLPGDRVGLIAFAGSAFLQAPLTIDYGAVLNALNELDTDIIPRGGTNIAQAIEVAREAFGKGESANQALVIFTDGEELDENALAEATRASKQIRIFTVGVGSEAGSVIPVPAAGGGTEFVKDPLGNVVKSKLNEGLLEKIAKEGGGFYLRLSNGPADMSRIVEQGLGRMTEKDIDARNARRPIERYQWPLAVGMALLTISLFITDRKRLRAGKRVALRPAAAVALATIIATPALASNGVEQYEKGDFKGAYQTFNDQLEWKPESPELHYGVGTAAYKLGNYDEALGAFSKALTTEDPALRSKAEYNLGNTLFRRGEAKEDKKAKIKEWKGALKHYDQALNLSPDDADAKYNRDTVAKLIEELEKEEKQQQQQQQNQQKQQKKQEQQDQQKQEQQQNQQDQQSGQDQQKQQQGGEQEKEKEGDQQQPQGGAGKQEPKEQQDQQEGERGEQSKPEPQENESQGEQAKQQDQEPRESGEESPRQGEQERRGRPEQQATPGPVPTPGERDLSGELKAQEDQKAGKPQEGEVAQAAEAEEDGKMSENQAAALLRSLQDEEARVPLNERPPAGRVLRDW